MTIIFVMDFGRAEPVSGAPIVKRIISLVEKVVIKRIQQSLSLIMSRVI
jgi:hypothetical protein